MARAGLLTLLAAMARVASDSEHVLLLGDSQCDVMQQMGSSLAETLAAHTPAHLDVTYTMDCDGWRRVARCTKLCCDCDAAKDDCCPLAGCSFPPLDPNAEGQEREESRNEMADMEISRCRRATDLARANSDVIGVVLWMGVNDIKLGNYPRTNDAAEVFATDYGAFLRAADSMPGVRFVVLVDPLPLDAGKLFTQTDRGWDMGPGDGTLRGASATIAAGVARAVDAVPTGLHVEHVTTADIAVASECYDGSHYIGSGASSRSPRRRASRWARTTCSSTRAPPRSPSSRCSSPRARACR